MTSSSSATDDASGVARFYEQTMLDISATHAGRGVAERIKSILDFLTSHCRFSMHHFVQSCKYAQELLTCINGFAPVHQEFIRKSIQENLVAVGLSLNFARPVSQNQPNFSRFIRQQNTIPRYIDTLADAEIFPSCSNIESSNHAHPEKSIPREQNFAILEIMFEITESDMNMLDGRSDILLTFSSSSSYISGQNSSTFGSPFTSHCKRPSCVRSIYLNGLDLNGFDLLDKIGAISVRQFVHRGINLLNLTLDGDVSAHQPQPRQQNGHGPRVRLEVWTYVDVKDVFKSAVTAQVMSEEGTIRLLDKVFKSISNQDAVAFSVICPLSNSRITIPIRFIHCSHLGCFDLFHTLRLISISPMPIVACPHCKTVISADHIRIDAFVYKILQRTNPDVQSVNVTRLFIAQEMLKLSATGSNMTNPIITPDSRTNPNSLMSNYIAPIPSHISVPNTFPHLATSSRAVVPISHSAFQQSTPSIGAPTGAAQGGIVLTKPLPVHVESTGTQIPHIALPKLSAQSFPLGASMQRRNSQLSATFRTQSHNPINKLDEHQHHCENEKESGSDSGDSDTNDDDLNAIKAGSKQKCSLCGILGHKKNSTLFHPFHSQRRHDRQICSTCGERTTSHTPKTCPIRDQTPSTRISTENQASINHTSLSNIQRIPPNNASSTISFAPNSQQSAASRAASPTTVSPLTHALVFNLPKSQGAAATSVHSIVSPETGNMDESNVLIGTPGVTVQTLQIPKTTYPPVAKSDSVPAAQADTDLVSAVSPSPAPAVDSTISLDASNSSKEKQLVSMDISSCKPTPSITSSVVRTDRSPFSSIVANATDSNVSSINSTAVRTDHPSLTDSFSIVANVSDSDASSVFGRQPEVTASNVPRKNQNKPGGRADSDGNVTKPSLVSMSSLVSIEPSDTASPATSSSSPSTSLLTTPSLPLSQSANSCDPSNSSSHASRDVTAVMNSNAITNAVVAATLKLFHAKTEARRRRLQMEKDKLGGKSDSDGHVNASTSVSIAPSHAVSLTTTSMPVVPSSSHLLSQSIESSAPSTSPSHVSGDATIAVSTSAAVAATLYLFHAKTEERRKRLRMEKDGSGGHSDSDGRVNSSSLKSIKPSDTVSSATTSMTVLPSSSQPISQSAESHEPLNSQSQVSGDAAVTVNTHSVVTATLELFHAKTAERRRRLRMERDQQRQNTETDADFLHRKQTTHAVEVLADITAEPIVAGGETEKEEGGVGKSHEVLEVQGVVEQELQQSRMMAEIDEDDGWASA